MFKTLSIKLLVVILPLITLAVILLFGLLEFRDFNARLQAKERQLIRLADTAAAALIQPIWEYNARAIREVLNDLSRDPNLLSVSVTDIDGHELAGIGDNQDIRHELNLTAGSDVVFTSGKRVEKLGKVRIAFHRDELKRHVNERLIADSIVLVGLIFTLTMLIVLATQRVIGRPVAALNRSIIRMQQQNSREPVAWKSSDELGLFINVSGGVNLRINGEFQIR